VSASSYMSYSLALKAVRMPCRRAMGSPLLDDMDIESIARVMWEAPAAILAHNKGSEAPGEQVVYTFANKVRHQRLSSLARRCSSSVPVVSYW
jgi:hypothetical protein